jgi:hypothetical protein
MWHEILSTPAGKKEMKIEALNHGLNEESRCVESAFHMPR